jgi:molecular chaperone DnaJ
MAKDYYKILGVSQDASHEEIKKTFRELAHKYHPDKTGGDEARFKEINEAYQVLGNAEKRKQYDQFGTTFDAAGGPGAGVSWEDVMRQAQQAGGFGNVNGVNFDFGDIGDIFGDFFAGGRSRRTTRGGPRR